MLVFQRLGRHCELCECAAMYSKRHFLVREEKERKGKIGKRKVGENACTGSDGSQSVINDNPPHTQATR